MSMPILDPIGPLAEVCFKHWLMLGLLEGDNEIGGNKITCQNLLRHARRHSNFKPAAVQTIDDD
ncbi:MAG TPA: hypothetical protein VEI95_11320 [Acidobacteriota bacterium]|nr:hypothetical protein [Acidobacteriota bacterium]